jgi:TPR repeat protein
VPSRLVSLNETIFIIVSYGYNNKKIRIFKMLEEAIRLYEEKNYEKAYEIFFDLALDRNAEALFFVGMMNHDGEGVEQNKEKGIEYWQRAATAGSIDAAYKLTEIRSSTKNMKGH